MVAITQNPRPRPQNEMDLPTPQPPPAFVIFRALARYKTASSRMSTSMGTSTVHPVNARPRVSLGGPTYPAANPTMGATLPRVVAPVFSWGPTLMRLAGMANNNYDYYSFSYHSWSYNNYH